MSTRRKWTEAEDSRLLRQVKAFPQNLTRCFMIVAEELDRTPGAVANHWYTSVSKNPDPRYTVSTYVTERMMLHNRKNGEGTPCSRTIFRRILSLLGLR